MIMITYKGRLVSFEDGIQSLLGHDTSNVWTLSLFLIKLTFDFYFLFFKKTKNMHRLYIIAMAHDWSWFEFGLVKL